MAKEQTSVPDIFRRALELARADEKLSLRDLRRRLYEEFKDSPMPPLNNLTIPEQDARAPCCTRLRRHVLRTPLQCACRSSS